MKKKLMISLFGLLPLLSGCINRRINVIVPGEYSGVDSVDESISCYLNLEEIEESSYKQANGQNVIKDLVNNSYYSIEFYTVSSNNERVDYTFSNFADVYNGAKDIHVSYVDENGVWFTPHTDENSKVLPYEECYYSIGVTDDSQDGFAIATYLFSKGV